MWNLKEFESIYSRYESSGLKVRDFCANEAINEAKFYYWQKKLREPKLPVQHFVPIVLGSNSAGSDLPCPANASYLLSINSVHYAGSDLPCPANASTTHSAIDSPEYEVVYPCGTILRVKGTVNAELLKVLIQLTR